MTSQKDTRRDVQRDVNTLTVCHGILACSTITTILSLIALGTIRRHTVIPKYFVVEHAFIGVFSGAISMISSENRETFNFDIKRFNTYNCISPVICGGIVYGLQSSIHAYRPITLILRVLYPTAICGISLYHNLFWDDYRSPIFKF